MKVRLFQPTQKTALALVLLAFALLAFANFSRLPVGHVNDDAKYISLAQSLLKGSYSDIAFIHQPPHNLYPPAYPLFLAFFVAAVQPHWELLKLISVSLGLLSCWLLWKILCRVFLPKLSWMGVALLALNPLTALFSTQVTSESLFLFSMLLSFWLFWLFLKEPTQTYSWALSLIVLTVALTRAVGILIPVAMAIPLIVRKEWRKLFCGLAFPFMGWFFWQLRNFSISNQSSYYTNYWKSEIIFFSTHPGALLDNIMRATYTFIIYAFQGVRLPHNLITVLLAALWAGIIFWLWGRGMRRLYSHRDLPKIWTESVVIFSVLYFVVHATWAVIEVRYAWALLPFLILGVLWGIPSVRYARLFALCLIVAFSYRHGIHLWGKPPDNFRPMPLQTFLWMKAHLPTESKILYPSIDSLWLYTGFQGVPGKISDGREEFLSQLRNDGISHVLYRPVITYSVPGTTGAYDQRNVFTMNSNWIAESTGSFHLIYLNREEQAAVLAFQ